MSESIEYFPEPDRPDVVEPDVGGEDVAGDAGPAPIVGMACEGDPDCETGTCIDTALLESLGLSGVEVPNGMCSTLACGGDDECGPRGFCFDTQPFSGAPIAICLIECTDLVDCRWQEGYSCYFDEEVGRSACLPDAIIVQIVCEGDECPDTGGEDAQ